MIAVEKVVEIRRLLALGQLSQRNIACIFSTASDSQTPSEIQQVIPGRCGPSSAAPPPLVTSICHRPSADNLSRGPTARPAVRLRLKRFPRRLQFLAQLADAAVGQMEPLGSH